MSKSKKSTGLPDYEMPPIIEVVCGLKFKGLESLKIPHYGAFWSKIDTKFPRCEHAQPIGSGPDVDDSVTGLPVPRIWLINKPDDRLVQLQKNALLYNWRKCENEPYPRYEKIIFEYKSLLDSFQSFLGDRKLGEIAPVECKLTYINMISEKDGWKTAGDVGKIFSDVSWKRRRGRFLPEPSQIGWNASFQLPDNNGKLDVRLDQRIRRVDGTPILMLELNAHGIGAHKKVSEIWDWYALAHDWIVQGFADLTQPIIQEKVWVKK